MVYRAADEDDVTAPPPQIRAAIKNNDIGNLLDLDWDEPTETVASPIMGDEQGQGNTFNDLLSIGGSSNTAPATNGKNNNIDDIMNLFNSSPVQQQPQPQQQPQFTSNSFSDDLLGGDFTQQLSPQQQKQNTTNDPFADLF